MRNVTCVTCGKDFRSKSPRAKFCSTYCRVSNHRKDNDTCYFCGLMVPNNKTLSELHFPGEGDYNACEFCSATGPLAPEMGLTEYCKALYWWYGQYFELNKDFCEWVKLPPDPVGDYRQYLVQKEQQYRRLIRAEAHIKLRWHENERAGKTPDGGIGDAGRRDQRAHSSSDANSESGRPDT